VKKIGIPSLVLLALFLGITGFAAFGVYTFRQDVTSMRLASEEDISWSATQIEQELAHFRESLLEFQLSIETADAKYINHRFDILWSRVAVFQQGRVGARLAAYETDGKTVSRLFDVMKSVELRVVRLKDGDGAEASRIFAQFEGFQSELARFSNVVSQGEEAGGLQIRESLATDVNRTLLLFALATIVALIAVGFINGQSLRFRKLAAENKALAVAAQRASLVKSRFLSMMSHELRTPMNGVLGLLALTKQNETQPRQRSLIERAEQAAQKMIALLADILDFSALESGDLKLDSKPFAVSHLAKAVADRFTAHAKREGIDFAVSIKDDCGVQVVADFRRLRQAFTHLMQYIVETAGAHDISAEFSCNADTLSMTLSFDYGDNGGDWEPDLILGTRDQDDNNFATDALGPAIARGMLERMHGSIRVDNPQGNRISVIASVPIKRFDAKILKVEVLAESVGMEEICKAALRGEGVEFLRHEDIGVVHFVLIETGNGKESTYLRQAQEKRPNALFVALGQPVNAEAFDFIIDLPLDFRELREIVYRQIA